MKKIISSWIGIFVGCTILAAGFVYFINPYNLVPGGVYGRIHTARCPPLPDGR